MNLNESRRAGRDFHLDSFNFITVQFISVALNTPKWSVCLDIQPSLVGVAGGGQCNKTKPAHDKQTSNIPPLPQQWRRQTINFSASPASEASAMWRRQELWLWADSWVTKGWRQIGRTLADQWM